VDDLQTEQKRRKLKNFKETCLFDKHSITLRGLQYVQALRATYGTVFTISLDFYVV